MTGIIHPHSVCVVSMLDPVMFGCATLVSAPVKEGPRNVSFVYNHLLIEKASGFF